MPPSKTENNDAPTAGAIADAVTDESFTVAVAIPARYASTRLPGKPLLEVGGRPLIEHVYRRARRVRGLSRVVVLTDDERIKEAVEGFGGELEMTPAECRSGTDRIASAAQRWDVDAVINVQGDEPLIDPGAIESVAGELRRLGKESGSLVTLASRAGREQLDDPNTVKVVCDRAGRALYFSRAPIPYPRHPEAAPVLQHIGIYGYDRHTLLRFAELEPTPLERSESLEQLRALENGIPIRVLEVNAAEPGIDTPEDLARLRERWDQEPTRGAAERNEPGTAHRE